MLFQRFEYITSLLHLRTSLGTREGMRSEAEYTRETFGNAVASLNKLPLKI
jgi:hypothetical protein